jgi:hypothetical protein
VPGPGSAACVGGYARHDVEHMAWDFAEPPASPVRFKSGPTLPEEAVLSRPKSCDGEATLFLGVVGRNYGLVAHVRCSLSARWWLPE